MGRTSQTHPTYCDQLARKGSQTMKLAESLIIRAECRKSLLRSAIRSEPTAKSKKLNRLAKIQEIWLKEAFSVLQEFEAIVVRINANLIVKLDVDRTLTEAIARCDLMAKRHALLTHAIQSAKQAPEYYAPATFDGRLLSMLPICGTIPTQAGSLCHCTS